MKKMKLSFLMLFVGLLFPSVAIAQQFNNEGMTYQVISEEQSTVMIYKAHRCVQHFDVPFRVEDYGGHAYWVTEIEYDAFRNLDCLYVLNLDGVKVLRDGYSKRYEDGAMDYFGTFANCRNLEKVVFGELTYLGDYAFYGCRKLVEVDLKKVEVVGRGAFRDCMGVSRVVLGKNLQRIAGTAFAGIEHLGQVEVHAEVPPVCAEDAFSESVYENAVLRVPEGKKGDYLQAEGWKIFRHVEELPVTAVQNLQSNTMKLRIENGVVVIEGVAEGELVEAYDVSGQLYVQKYSAGHPVCLRLACGKIYWIKVGNQKVSGIRL